MALFLDCQNGKGLWLRDLWGRVWLCSAEFAQMRSALRDGAEGARSDGRMLRDVGDGTFLLLFGDHDKRHARTEEVSGKIRGMTW